MGPQVGENPFDVIILEKRKVRTFVFEDRRDEVYDVVGVLGRREKIVKGTQSAFGVRIMKSDENRRRRRRGRRRKKGFFSES